jgi:predicted O-linked N-acetylglucosamine transferase (SPINDLY family)
LYIANNPEEVHKLKAKLKKQKERSPLYNSELYIQDLENTYLNMVKKSN